MSYAEKIESLVAERDAAIREAHDNKQRARAFQKDAERYHWLRGRVPGSTYRIIGVVYSEGGAGVDAAIDAAMAGR